MLVAQGKYMADAIRPIGASGGTRYRTLFLRIIILEGPANPATIFLRLCNLSSFPIERINRYANRSRD